MSGADITNAVAAIIAANKAQYEASGDTTHCSEFVRDFWSQLTSSTSADLEGQANDQITTLIASSNWDRFALGA
jgi:hypothetical protein